MVTCDVTDSRKFLLSTWNKGTILKSIFVIVFLVLNSVESVHSERLLGGKL